MTREEFRCLTHSEQDEEVMNHGKFLFTFDYKNLMCDLYRLYNFNVGFCYDLRKNYKPVIIVFPNASAAHIHKGNTEHFSVN